MFFKEKQEKQKKLESKNNNHFLQRKDHDVNDV